MKKIKEKKPMLCAYCKKIIYKEKNCFEKHSGKYYHADCKQKEKKIK